MNFSLTDIDTIRRIGFRPTAVACFLHEKKVLLAYHEEYRLWQLPQGGVDNHELPEVAIRREATEELGPSFTQHMTDELYFVGRDRVEFPPEKYNLRKLQLDDGSPVEMLGKEYLFFGVPVSEVELVVEESEFSQHEWHTYTSAQARIEEIYQPGKQRITRRAIQFLFDEGLLDE